jgi:Phytanoyl-CoA dioxygenase (PhyH)
MIATAGAGDTIGGFATRQLHSDRDETIFAAQRPIVLNGIGDLAARPDLADRALSVILPPIPDDRRREEREFWAVFETARPKILGALLDAVAAGLWHLPNIRLDRRPRMADKGPIHDHHGPDGRFCGAIDPENCHIDLSRAVPCLGEAGSITIHHVRAVHGSANNFSGRSCRFLLFQYRAADAWPLLGPKEGIEKFNEQRIVGEPSLAPRLVPLPVRMPLPPAEHQGSIYENQRAAGRRYFVTSDEAPRIAAE